MNTHTIAVTRTSAESGHPYDKRFKRCIGTGRFALGLRTDYMDNLRLVQQEIGFDYIRGHGIFHDELGCYRESIQVDSQRQIILQQPIFQFIRVLKVIDNWRSVGIRPFIELGFMPEQLASGADSVFWWKGNVTPPKSIELWSNLVEKLLEALIAHYGEDEVSRWPIEVWNEPNSPFWCPPNPNERELTYYQLYEATARVVKRVHPGLQIGGPSTNPGGYEWIPRFIDYCEKHEVPLDFISHHVYTGHNKQYSAEFIYMDQMEPQQGYEQFERAAQLSRMSSGEQLPLHITEWNSSYSCIDPIHDTSMNAAYIAWLLVHVDHLVDSYAYWVVSDVFEEADIPRALFHGGFGLVTHNGVRKPVFYAFQFANSLKETIVHLDNYSCVTVGKDGSIAVLLFHPCIQSQQVEPIEIKLELPFKHNHAVVSTRSVDDEVGNAYTAWKRIGRPRAPLPAEMDIIRRAQIPQQTLDSIDLEGEEIVCLRVTLPPNGIKLIELLPVKDYSGEYEGLQTIYEEGN
jgi:xylan 1,4-beta-xylosidase